MTTTQTIVTITGLGSASIFLILAGMGIRWRIQDRRRRTSFERHSTQAIMVVHHDGAPLTTAEYAAIAKLEYTYRNVPAYQRDGAA